jgi:ketosteroid isomerase-like protein
MPQNIPAAKRRNYALAENVSFPFHAEPTHPDVRENAMKTFLVMMTLIFSAGLEALQANAQNVDASAKVLITLTNEWTAAINRKDRAKLDEIMSKDFARYAWDGSEGTPRLEWLENLFAHVKIEKNTLVALTPRVYGNFAIVTSKGDWIGSWDGKSFAMKCIVVDTWQKQSGNWKVVTRTSDCANQ